MKKLITCKIKFKKNKILLTKNKINSYFDGYLRKIY